MAFTKTRIWRGGVAGIAPPPKSSDLGPEPVPFSDTLHGNISHSEQESLAALGSALEQDLERAAERVTGAMLPGFQALKPTAMSTTRFMPIEQLFPEQHESAKRAHALTPAPAPHWNARVRGWFARRTTARRERLVSPRQARRRLLFVASAVLACVLALAAALPALRERLPGRSGARGAHDNLEPETRVPAPGAAQERPAPANDAARAPGHRHTVARREKPAGLERSAIDALISGDLARAADLYRRLSESAPEEGVYREALRILRDRSVPR